MHKLHRSILLTTVIAMIAIFTPILVSLAEDAGMSLLFDSSDDYVAFGDTGDLFAGTGWVGEKTISVWVKPTAASGPNVPPESGAMIAGNDRPRLFGISLANWNGNDKIWVWSIDSDNQADRIGIDYSPGVWTQITMVHSAGTLYAYKDGQFVASVASGDTAVPNHNSGDGDLFIGGTGRTTASHYFQGEIDELRFWNVALDQTTLLAWTYQPVNASHPSYANLKAYYQMFNGLGATLSDDSGNDNTGSLLGGMGDANWVTSDALIQPTPTPIPSPTSTPTETTVAPTATLTAIPTATATTVVVTDTPAPPTATPTLDATATPTNTPNPQGYGGWSLEFDSIDDHVAFGDTGDLFAGTGWVGEKTISVWVKPTAASGPNVPPESGAMIAGNDRPRLFGISLANWNGNDKIWVWSIDSDNQADRIGIDYSPGVWTQITMVHSAGTLYAYKDGQFVASVASGDTAVPNHNSGDGDLFSGGTGRTTASHYFQGEIDELRFWNVALDQTTLLAWTYQPVNASHPSYANLKAYYQMSNGLGATLSDDSINSNGGILLGGMGDSNWDTSDALIVPPTPTSTPTSLPTSTPTPTTAPTATPTPTATATHSSTPSQPTATPTATATTVSVTNTPVPTTTATPTNPPNPQGYGGWSLLFDSSDDYVAFGDTGDLFAGTGWVGEKTISVWVKPTAASGPNVPPESGAMIAGNDRPRLFGISLANWNGNDKIWVWSIDSDNQADRIGIDYSPGVWTQITMVHSAGTLYAYKDGQFVASVASGDTAVPNHNSGDGDLFSGGTGRTTASHYFQGEIDELRFWNVALDQTTLLAWTYQPVNASHPSYANLKAYYQMFNGLGATLSDDSGNDNTGSLLGGMGDANWVTSDALIQPTPTPIPSPTFTPTETTVAPTATPTPSDTPTATATTVVVTDTPAPPTATPTLDATATPTNTPNPQGYGGWSLEFDGIDDHVDFGDTGDLFAGDSWASEKTISVWVKPTAASGPNVPLTEGNMIITNDFPRWFGITRAISGGNDRIWVWNGDGGTIDTIGIDFTPGEWIQVTMVHSAGMLYAYKNGELVDATPSGPTVIPNNNTGDGDLFIGGTGRTTASHYFQGEIDELRFWNVALDQTTLLAWTYQPVNASHPSYANLKAYYQMSNGLGATLSDDSINSNGGILLGGMGDANWDTSDALIVPPTPTSTPTSLPTSTPTPTTAPTATPTPTATATHSSTPSQPTATPTATATTVSVTNTPVPTTTATPTNPPNPQGYGGWSLLFDSSDDYVAFGDTGDLFAGTGWVGEKTISVWVKPTAASGPNVPPESGAMIAGNDRPRLFGISLANWNGNDKIWVWSIDSDNQADRIGIDYSPGVWTQITMVHSAGTLYAYKDGQFVASVASGDTAVPNHNSGDGDLFSGGTGRTTASHYFQGEIDELRFWNVALDQTTLLAWTYQPVNASHPSYANLKAYYQMFNGLGATLSDDSGNDNTGSLLGGMGDANWVTSDALIFPPTPTPSATPALPAVEPAH